MYIDDLPIRLPGQSDIKEMISSSPKTANLVNSLSSITQAPWEMSLLGTLGSYSTVIQGLADVKKIQGGVGSLATYILIIAESGERKTTVQNLLNKPIAEFQKKAAKQYKDELDDYRIDLRVSEEEMKKLEKELSMAVREADQEAIDKIKKQMKQSMAERPIEPLKLQLTYEDATPESIAFDLHRGWRNAALVSNEGATILEGRIIQKVPLLNSLWSGEAFSVNRRETSASFEVTDARLTLFIATQPSAMTKFMKRRGEETQGIGFLGRFIISYPNSTQGTRFSASVRAGSDEGLKSYYKQIEGLLNKIPERQKRSYKRDIIEWSAEAKKSAIQIHDFIERELGPGGRFEHANAHGNKLFENISRIAALLTYIELGEGKDITSGILNDAKTIAFHFSGTYLKHFQVLPDYLKDVNALIDYFNAKKENGERFILKNLVLRSGPYRTRNAKSLNQAIQILIANGMIKVWTYPQTGLTFIDIDPTAINDGFLWNKFCHANNLPPQIQPNPLPSLLRHH